jgi:hypothetical protein
MEHHHSFILPIKYASYHLTELTQRIPFLLQRLLSYLTSHSSHNPPLKTLLNTPQPHQSMIPPLPKDISQFGRQFPKPSPKFPSFTLHQVSKIFR